MAEKIVEKYVTVHGFVTAFAAPLKNDIVLFRDRLLYLNSVTTVAFWFLTFIIAMLTVSAAIADDFKINLKTGSIFTVEAGQQSIRWTDVQASGKTQQREIPLIKVKQLVLSESPVSKQMALIRQQLARLNSPDYLERESAEEQLSDDEVASRFRSLIQSEADNPDLELRYRINRILDQLEGDAYETSNEYDLLTLVDGTQLQGDAGEVSLSCEYRGRELTFSRSEIQSINLSDPSPQFDENSQVLDVKVFHKFENEFYLPNQTTIDFEKSPSGQELTRNTNVSEMFTSAGVIFSSEQPGHVGISGYGFKFPMPPAVNSVCVFETAGSNTKKFKGVMEMRFCVPNQPAVMAGVQEIGFFIARVDRPRDFIVEAYNASGQILATVESSDQKCVFAGVKSSQPITLVRVLSNPYLYNVDRRIDEDYAIDQLCFSTPVAVAGIANSQTRVVQMKDGDLLNGDSIEIKEQRVLVGWKSKQERIELPLSDVKVIRFDTVPQPLPKSQRSWRAMLADRSIVSVNPSNSFHTDWLGGIEFQRDELAGLWLATNKIRIPLSGDFEVGESVLVFPTCRLAASDLKLTSDGYAWSRAEKLEQNLWLDEERKGHDDESYEDPTPQIEHVDFEETSPELVPTLWLQPPRGSESDTGLLRLVDGQQFVIGGTSGFTIGDLDADFVTLSRSGKTEKIDLKRVLSLEFP